MDRTGKLASGEDLVGKGMAHPKNSVCQRYANIFLDRSHYNGTRFMICRDKNPATVVGVLQLLDGCRRGGLGPDSVHSKESKAGIGIRAN
jgi:hypothetical protein